MNTDKSKLYTARWYALKIKAINTDSKIDSMTDDLVEILSDLLQEPIPEEVKPVEPPRPDANQKPIDTTPVTAAKALWYPKAHILKGVTKSAKGTYPKGYPEGLVVHFTAGQYTHGIKDATDSISSSPYFYMAVGTDGKIVQSNPLNQWGYHAGESAWVIEGKKVSGLSNRLVGLEICNPGRLELINGKYYTWFDKKTPIDPKLVRIAKADNDNIQKGAYLPYSKEQEQALIELCLWLKMNNPEVFNFDLVLGHDEISGKKGIGYNRKNDPGAALSMTMTELRELLKKEYEKLNK